MSPYVIVAIHDPVRRPHRSVLSPSLPIPELGNGPSGGQISLDSDAGSEWSVLCRVGGGPGWQGPLVSPCVCRGSSKWIHVQCLVAWWKTRGPQPGDKHPQYHHSILPRCPTCKQPYYGDVAVKLAHINLRQVESMKGEDSVEVAAALNTLGALMSDAGHYLQAEELHRRALRIREKLGPDHPEVAQSLNSLGGVMKQQGRYGEAVGLLRRSLEILEASLGSGHPGVATALNNLGRSLVDMNQTQDAQAHYLRALSIQEKKLGPDHPDVAQSLNNIGLLKKDLGALEDATQFLSRALRIREKVLGEDHPDVAETLNALGGLYKRQGLYQEAEVMFTRSLSILESILGSCHPDVATALNNLAGLVRLGGGGQGPAKAEPLYIRAVAIFRKALSSEHPHLASALSNLASLLTHLKRYSEAEVLHREALGIREISLGPANPVLSTQFKKLAEVLRQQGKFSEALPLLTRALSIDQKLYPPNHAEIASCKLSLSVVTEQIKQREADRETFSVVPTTKNFHSNDTVDAYLTGGQLPMFQDKHASRESLPLKELKDTSVLVHSSLPDLEPSQMLSSTGAGSTTTSNTHTNPAVENSLVPGVPGGLRKLSLGRRGGLSHNQGGAPTTLTELRKCYQSEMGTNRRGSGEGVQVEESGMSVLSDITVDSSIFGTSPSRTEASLEDAASVSQLRRLEPVEEQVSRGATGRDPRESTPLVEGESSRSGFPSTNRPSFSGNTRGMPAPVQAECSQSNLSCPSRSSTSCENTSSSSYIQVEISHSNLHQAVTPLTSTNHRQTSLQNPPVRSESSSPELAPAPPAIPRENCHASGRPLSPKLARKRNMFSRSPTSTVRYTAQDPPPAPNPQSFPDLQSAGAPNHRSELMSSVAAPGRVMLGQHDPDMSSPTTSGTPTFSRRIMHLARFGSISQTDGPASQPATSPEAVAGPSSHIQGEVSYPSRPQSPANSRLSSQNKTQISRDISLSRSIRNKGRDFLRPLTGSLVDRSSDQSSDRSLMETVNGASGSSRSNRLSERSQILSRILDSKFSPFQAARNNPLRRSAPDAAPLRRGVFSGEENSTTVHSSIQFRTIPQLPAGLEANNRYRTS